MNKLSLLKKVALVLCFFVPATVTVLAQESESASKTIQFGIKGGYSSSGFTNHYEIFTEKKAGFTIGAFAEFRPTSLIGIETGINYLREGAFHVSPRNVYPATYLNSLGSIGINSTDITFHTIQIPLLINFRPTTGSVQPRITAGWSFDYTPKVSAQDNIYTSAIFIEDRNKQDVSKNFKDFNTGPIIGLGLDFDAPKYKYLIDVRHKVGLRNMSNLGSLQTTNQTSPFSVSTWTVTVGLALK